MTTLTSGCYTGCPIKYLPTGYILFLIKNGKMKSRWYEFYEELRTRIQNLREPELPREILESSWFTSWDDADRERYASMMTDGLFDWAGTTGKGLRGLEELSDIYGKLATLYDN